tara:strand:+ start:374 stop:1807 length:1434 start_codon:yes stop_codon:yes gene_type:complete
MGEAAHLAGQRQWAERQRARQQQIELARERMAQQQQQFNQQLQSQMFGRQQSIDAANQRMLFGAQQQAARQQQAFQNQQALGQQRSDQARENYEFLNDQRHRQQISLVNYRDQAQIAQADQAYDNPTETLNPAGQKMASKIRLMEDRINSDDTLNQGERELALMKLSRRKMILNDPQFQKQPEREPFMEVPGDRAGILVLNPKTGGYEYKQAPHPETGMIKEHTLPDGRKIQIQRDYRGEWRPLMPDSSIGGRPGNGGPGLGEYKWDFNKEWEIARKELQDQAGVNPMTGAKNPVSQSDIIERLRAKREALQKIADQERLEREEGGKTGLHRATADFLDSWYDQMAPEREQQALATQRKMWGRTPQERAAAHAKAFGQHAPIRRTRKPRTEYVSAEQLAQAENEPPITSLDQVKSHPRYMAAKPGEKVIIMVQTDEGVRPLRFTKPGSPGAPKSAKPKPSPGRRTSSVSPVSSWGTL